MKLNNTILFIKNRLPSNSENQEIFNSSIQNYQDALIASGYEGNISYENIAIETQSKYR